jgi:hypothetical protein
VEAGSGWSAGNSSSIRYAADDNNDLSQPLLAAAAAPAGDSAIVHGEVGTAGGEVHGHYLARQVTPDMLMHVGNDVSHGRRDVAESPFDAPVVKGSAAVTITAGSYVEATGVFMLSVILINISCAHIAGSRLEFKRTPASRPRGFQQ